MRNFRQLEQFVFQQLSALPPALHYHGGHHTQDVLQAIELITAHEKVTPDELLLLNVAALYHDVGFLDTYKGHEAAGCVRARAELPGFGFTTDEVELICGMIMATLIPQTPHTLLERIVADADLEYLGTNRFKKIGEQLFKEMVDYKMLSSETEWNRLQLNFLKSHRYHTSFCKEFREPVKQQHIAELEKLLA